MNEFRNVTLPMPFNAAPGSAKYCNSALVLHSPWEFSFELSQITPIVAVGQGEGQQVQVQAGKLVHDWIAMSPTHAKAFLKALTENVARYEEEHGAIPEIEQPTVQQGGENE
jgi:Protein of unknown function (DUF3467)